MLLEHFLKGEFFGADESDEVEERCPPLLAAGMVIEKVGSVISVGRASIQAGGIILGWYVERSVFSLVISAGCTS